MHICFKIVKFYYNLCCSTCFGHCCVHHQEPSTSAHAASGYRVVWCCVGCVLQPCSVVSNIIIKFLLHSTLLYMFRTLLCPSSGAFYHCTCSLWLPCGVVSVASSSSVLLLLTTEQGCRTQPTQHHTTR
jgi:hypothetical protein